MQITEQPIDWPRVNLTASAAKYPQSRTNPHLPRNYMLAVVAGARGSGKTFAAVELIKQMERGQMTDPEGHARPVRTILVSPTALANPVYDSLGSLDPDDIHLDYSDDLIHKIVDDIKKTKDDAEEYQETMKVFRKWAKMRDENDLTFDELMLLAKHGFEPPPKPKYEWPPITNLVLDDLVGSQALRPGRSPLTYLAIRNRHHACNIMLLVQAVKQVPKVLRNNASVYMVFPFANSKMILEDLYPEVSNILKEEEFVQLFEHATTGDDRPFLLMDFTKDKKHYFRRKFDRYLLLNKGQDVKPNGGSGIRGAVEAGKEPVSGDTRDAPKGGS